MIPDKRALRTALRLTRQNHSRQPILVSDAFAGRLRPGLTVATYIPIGSEADPTPLVRVAVDAGCTLALPHVVDRATPLRFLARQDDDALVTGPFDLRQPTAESAPLHPDIILTPLVGFDRTGARLGQGAGHYDRAFAEFPDAWRIGVAFSCQEVDRLPTDTWDIPLNAIATDKEWIEP